MTAPALILLADGSMDPRVTQVTHTLRKHLQELRPELSVNLAFLDHCPPTGPQVITTLANRGMTEVVFVPLSMTRAIECGTAAQDMVTRVRTAHPDLKVGVARPVGPACELLNVLDIRLRQSLAACRSLELDGLVLAVPDAGDTRGAALISRRARQWSAHHRLPVQIAHGDGSGLSVSTAIANLREQGRRSIAVGSFWLAADDSFARLTTLALNAGAIAVSAPLACDERILDLAMARYAFAAMNLLDDFQAEAFPTADADLELAAGD